MTPSIQQWDRIGQVLAATSTILIIIGLFTLLTNVVSNAIDLSLGTSTISIIPSEVSLIVALFGIGLVPLTRWIAAKYSSYDVEWWGSTK